MPRKKQKKDVLDKSWTNLSQLNTFFTTTKQEKVVEFVGHTLTTTKHVYGLYDGQLSRSERVKKPVIEKIDQKKTINQNNSSKKTKKVKKTAS